MSNNPIDNLKRKEHQQFTDAIEREMPKAQPAAPPPPPTPTPPPQMGDVATPQPVVIDPNNLPTGTPNYVNTEPVGGNFSSPPTMELTGGATPQEVLDSVVKPTVDAELRNTEAFNEQSDANVRAATQELLYPALYTPPSIDQLRDEFIYNSGLQRTWFQQQQALADEQTRQSNQVAQDMLERLQRIPPPSGSATEDAFKWVESFLGIKKDASGRQYSEFSKGGGNVNIPASLLYFLGLSQNMVMGAGIDAYNSFSGAFNALPPWLKSGVKWTLDFNPIKAGLDRLAEKNEVFKGPASWFGVMGSLRPNIGKLNDGKSNFIEAIRGAQYGFSDDQGVGFGIKKDEGFRVGMPAGKGFGFDVNPTLLAGLALDVFVGAKVDKLIKFGRGAARGASVTADTTDPALREWQRANLTNPGEAQLNKPGAVIVTPPPPTSTGKTAQQFQQLEFSFMQNVPRNSPVQVPAKAASTAKKIRQVQRASQQLELKLDDLPEAAPPSPPKVSQRVKPAVVAQPDEPLALRPGSTIAESPHVEIRTPTKVVKATTTTQAIAREMAAEATAVVGKLPDDAVDVIKAAAQAVDEAIPEIVTKGVVNSIEEIRQVLDDLPAVVVDDPALQGVANVVNATIRNNALGELAKAVGVNADEAVAALDDTADIGRKFVGEVPKVELPPNLELPKADSFTLVPVSDEPLFHGTRVVNHTLKGTDPIVGGARNELGTAHYLTTDSNVAGFAAKADSATNLPGGVNREIGSPSIYDVKLSPEAKLVDAKAPSSAYNDLARQLGVDVGSTPKSLVQVFDEVSQRLDEVEALTFQRQFTEALRTSGIDGARAGNTIAIYNPTAIADEVASAVDDSVEVLPKLSASLELAADSVKQTGSEFSKSIAADANVKLQAQTVHELKYLLNDEAIAASELIDTSGLWDDITIPSDAAIMHHTGYVIDYVDDTTLATRYNDVVRSLVDPNHPGYIFRELDDWHITVPDVEANDAAFKAFFNTIDRITDDLLLGDYTVTDALQRLEEVRSEILDYIDDTLGIYKAMNAGNIDYAQFPGVNLGKKLSNDYVAHYDRQVLDEAFTAYAKFSDNATPLISERGLLGAVLELYRSTRFYKIVNQFLASKDVAKTASAVGTTPEKVIAGVNLIGALDVALLSMPQIKQTLYRRVPSWEKSLKRYPVGQVVEVPTFQSVATTNSINSDTFGEVTLVIKDGVGHKLLFNPAEGEVLIPRNQRFYVESVDKTSKTITMRQLGGDSLLGVNAQGLWKEGKKLLAGVGFSETGLPLQLRSIYQALEEKVWNTLGKVRTETPPKLPANTTLNPLARPLKDIKSFMEQEGLTELKPIKDVVGDENLTISNFKALTLVGWKKPVKELLDNPSTSAELLYSTKLSLEGLVGLAKSTNAPTQIPALNEYIAKISEKLASMKDSVATVFGGDKYKSFIVAPDNVFMKLPVDMVYQKALNLGTSFTLKLPDLPAGVTLDGNEEAVWSRLEEAAKDLLNNDVKYRDQGIIEYSQAHNSYSNISEALGYNFREMLDVIAWKTAEAMSPEVANKYMNNLLSFKSPDKMAPHELLIASKANKHWVNDKWKFAPKPKDPFEVGMATYDVPTATKAYDELNEIALTKPMSKAEVQALDKKLDELYEHIQELKKNSPCDL